MKNTVKSVIVLVLIFAVMMLGITGVNAYTAPIIAANGSAAVYEPLLEVMPDAQDFEPLYDAADPAASTLTDVPETVQGPVPRDLRSRLCHPPVHHQRAIPASL